MKPTLVEVKVGRMRVKAPLIVDEATTLRVAEQVNARLEEIERNSDRLDSLEFALLAAMSFAAELDLGKRAVAEERERLAESGAEASKEFFVELDKIAHALEREPRKKGPGFRS
jgi:cell division protein ZapA (FtsZ GTPase activity inhibitor)